MKGISVYLYGKHPLQATPPLYRGLQMHTFYIRSTRGMHVQ